MTSEEVIKLIKELAASEGWTWREPVRAKKCRKGWRGPWVWDVISNSNCKGCNVVALVDDETGKILGKGFMPR